MARLMVAELRRITARRVVRLTVVLTLVGIALGGVAAFAWSGSLSEATYQQRVAEAKARQVAEEAEIEACMRAQGASDDEIAQRDRRGVHPRLTPSER